MRTFQLVVGVIALIVLTAQTIRHVYVRWIEPRGTVLEQFKDNTEKDISSSQELEKLVALYRDAWNKVNEHEKNYPDEKQSSNDYERTQKEPYKSAALLKNAILLWEDHSNQIKELHFFWWAGFVFVLLGAICFARTNEWLGLTVLVLGFLEMLWATCPSFRTFGAQVEFDRLLTWKVIYSGASMLFVMAGWLYSGRAAQRSPT